MPCNNLNSLKKINCLRDAAIYYHIFLYRNKTQNRGRSILKENQEAKEVHKQNTHWDRKHYLIEERVLLALCTWQLVNHPPQYHLSHSQLD